MQVLEMEPFVGNPSRKRLNGSQKNKSGKCDAVITCAQGNALLPKLVVAASLILLGLLYLSAQDDGGDALGGVENKTPDVSSNFVEIETSPQPIQTDKPTVSATLPPSPVPIKEIVEENKSTVSPTQPPSPAPIEKIVEEEDESSSTNDGPENYDAFLYSKYATILPLVDHPLPNDEEIEKLEEKYGRWHFWDGDEEERPMEDYTAKYPNRDMPGEDFPDDSWQADAVYVNHILNDADQLIGRAMEAIFVEYGHGKPLPPEGLAERMKMFHWSREDLSAEKSEAPEKYKKHGDRGNGGWTTKRSFSGLVRRLLHAMMTQDTFTVVMAGHSAAVGKGNHFRQSYMMQFHKVMYPIFARLGVKLITRNIGQAGLGTIQGGMGSGSIYGDEVDLLLWDSGMTESDPEHVDIFYRQALLAGNRVPVLWGGPFKLLQMLHEEADVDVGDWGTAMDGIMEVEDLEQAKTIPWAARYLKCKDEANDICKEESRFCSKCWSDREDNIVPEAKQRDHPEGQVKWHPGWRSHQLMGRNIAFAVLEALQSAINIWTEGVMGGPPLEDDFWHVTDYYENIRNKVKNLDVGLGSCYKIEGNLPTRLCNTPMKAKTQYTPRANPNESALTSIIKPTSDGYIPTNTRTMLYEGPDAHNTCFDIPEGEVDVFNVVTGRRRLEDSFKSPSLPDRHQVDDFMYHSTSPLARNLQDTITPGKGWEVWEEPPGFCDGTYNATCGRWTGDDCFLNGHHDARAAVIGNEFSGWLVMSLKDLKEGIIILKLHTWHTEEESTLTKGWTSVENQQRRLGQSSTSFEAKDVTPANRMLTRDYSTPELSDEFAFDYAIDGEITTLTKDQLLKEKKNIQRVVETLTILDDPNFTSEAKDVEIAIRLRGCGRSIVFGVSHVYWA
mmetsp:Transcript_27767/g.65251  ORF Transcript_27767/g.65251 Transcript_27767/m.65251 type:complete len:895 (-) Transcript_27767:3416-6100(-)